MLLMKEVEEMLWRGSAYDEFYGRFQEFAMSQ